ncbi:ribonuclease H-like domain-containing protein [Tanacetum coccineum]
MPLNPHVPEDPFSADIPFTIWMEQYLTFTDHDLWEVIVNGDLVSPIASASAGAEGPIPPKTLARSNVLWKLIKNRFGGNKESKKMQKTILKQNYENFVASSQEELDKTYDRFQKLISQLEIHGEVISQEDVNLMLLRNLPSAWNNIALIMRNKSDIDTLSMDDLYYNLKLICYDVSVASSQGQVSSSTYADDVMLSFFANQSNMAMLTIRVKRFIKKIGRKMDLNDKETVGFDRTKVECYNYHRRGHFARECKEPRNQGNRNIDAPRRNALVDTSTTNALVVQDGIVQTLSAKDKTGLRYDSQMNESELNNIHMNESEVVHSVINSRESDVDDSLINDRFKTNEFVFQSAVRKTTTTVPETETSISKDESDILESLKLVNNVTTAGPKAVVSAAEGNEENAANGCSRHMSGNKSFLTDYQENVVDFVWHLENPKGLKITRKVTAGNQTNRNAGIKDNVDAEDANTFVSTASSQRNADTTADDLTLVKTLMEIRKSVSKDKGMTEIAQSYKNSLDAAERQKNGSMHQAAKGEKCSEEDLPMKLVELVNQRNKFFSQQRAKAKRNKPMTPAQQNDYMSNYIKNQEGEGTIFCAYGSELEVQRLKRASQEVLENPIKRQKIGEASGSGEEQSAEKEKELSEEELQKLLVIVPMEELVIQPLQVRYSIIDWEVYSEDTRRDDLVKLWDLVKETFSTTEPTDDKENEM